MTNERGLADAEHLHVVAIGGYAMSAIARYCTQLGMRVSGCDVTDSETLTRLRAEGIDCVVGHDPSHLVPESGARPDVISVATAVRRDLPEVAAAVDAGLTVLSRGETMVFVAGTKPQVAVVSGTHGKTSTSAMVSFVLDAVDAHPSFFVGGTIADFGTNARYDAAGEWLVVEGDESDHSFLDFRRDVALVTNIEADHLDRWGDSFDSLVAGFAQFIDTATGPAVLCVDDAVVASLAATRPDAITYGATPDARLRITGYEPTRGGCVVEITSDGDTRPMALRLRGRDMAQNAVGAVALAGATGVDLDAAIAALADFHGVARRFEYKANLNGADCYDDYAHTATEIRTTLARAREGGWSRVVAVVQPHRYTRIQRHGHEFGDAFDDADVVVVAGLDPAFEDPIEGVSSQIVIDAIRAARPALPVIDRPDWDDLRDVPWSVARAGDCIVTLGCGSITNVHRDWSAEAQSR